MVESFKFEIFQKNYTNINYRTILKQILHKRYLTKFSIVYKEITKLIFENELFMLLKTNVFLLVFQSTKVSQNSVPASMICHCSWQLVHFGDLVNDLLRQARRQGIVCSPASVVQAYTTIQVIQDNESSLQFLVFAVAGALCVVVFT